MTSEHRQALVRLGVDGADRWCEHLSDDAVAGVIHWARDQGNRGHAPTSAQVALKLKNGGLAGFGTQASPSQRWYRNSEKRWKWMQDNVFNLDPVYAEAAILELARAKQEPSVDGVKALTVRLEREQFDYERGVG